VSEKRTQRFGDPPAADGDGDGAVRRAPLPLMTQQVAVPSVPGGQGVADLTAATPRPRAHTSELGAPAARTRAPSAQVLPAATTRMPVATTIANVGAGGLDRAREELPAARDAGPAPEISLTQHHLPAEDAEGSDARLVLVNDPDSPRAANFRVLRHHILEAGRPQVIVVSSARPGEGKTTTAVNLALALAECGRAKVLLVETNLQRPQLASMFRVVPSWCFAEQLAAHRHQPMLPWSLIDIPQLWLHVAAVNPRVEQRQLLDAPAFAIAMERLRLGGYDHIVIDSPPVLGSADVNLMQDAADGVLLTVRGRVSTARDLRRTIDQLSPARVLGSVLLE
jgi:Mrp family chromosome partitioning ATPase